MCKLHFFVGYFGGFVGYQITYIIGGNIVPDRLAIREIMQNIVREGDC